MTRAEAIKQVLQNLLVLDSISNPAPEDAAVVGQRLDQERDRLIERGLCWWPEDEIPGAVSAAFCDLVAERCGPAFGRPFTAIKGEGRIAAVKSSAVVEHMRAHYF